MSASIAVPRLPTSGEVEEIRECIFQKSCLPTTSEKDLRQDIQSDLEASAIAIFDNAEFLPFDKVHKIAMIVYPLDASYYEVFIWDENQHIRCVKQEKGLNEELG